MPSVLVEPLLDFGWNGMSVDWTSYDIPKPCPNIPGLNCGSVSGNVYTDYVYAYISLDGYDYDY